MGRTVETISTVNSLIRTLLGVVIVGGIGAGAWFGYSVYTQRDRVLREKDQDLATARADLDEKVQELADKEVIITRQVEELVVKDTEIDELNEEVAEQAAEIEKLDTAIRLLKIDHRLAKITVVDQQQDPDTDKLFTTIEFVELNDEGQPIDDPKRFRLAGDVVYVDYWVVKFEDKYVEEADLLRSTSLCLFRRIFGEQQEPMAGFVLDKVGARPKAYARGSKLTEFEKKVWDDFWDIANEPSKAKQLGIRAAHGEAVSTKLRPGKQYRLDLRASGGLSIKPAEDAPALPAGPAI